MNRIFILSLALVFSAATMAQTTLPAFKKKIQEEIVKGMELANSDSLPIQYGGQGSADAPEGELDSTYWQKTGNYTFKLKPKKSASKAIRAIFPTSMNDKNVLLECHSMMISIIYRSILEGIGAEKFDALFGKEGQANQKLIIKSGDLKTSGLEKFFLKTQVAKEKIEMGDWVYFENNEHYLDKHPEGPWQGENGIYVGLRGGQKIYSGFGAADKTEKEMLKELLDAYNVEQSAEDLEILNAEWAKMLKWLKPNSVSSKDKYFQLNPKVFKLPRSFDYEDEDDVDTVFTPVAKALGFDSTDAFGYEFEYGVEEMGDGYFFYVEKIKPYEDKIKASDIPGITRIDRLDYAQLFKLK